MATAEQQAAVQYAGFWTRFAAYLIDGVILVPVNLIIQYGLIRGAAGNLLSIIVSLVYLVGLWTWRGQTLGKMAMHIRIIKKDGTPIALGTAILRYVGYWVSGIILGIGFLMIAWDSKKQGLHDKIAGTYVVKV